MPPNQPVPRVNLGAALQRLLDVAGLTPDEARARLRERPEYEQVRRATLYDWRRGRRLPMRPDGFLALVEECLKAADERGADLGALPSSRRGWERLLNAAKRARDARFPPLVGRIPDLAGFFQRRRGLANLMGSALSGGGTAVLTGTGGVGKTQMATAYAWDVWQAGEVDLVVWISAGRPDAVVAGYAEAYAEVAGGDLGDPERAAGRFLTWLRTIRGCWLVVLDDVTAPADLAGLWPPPHADGQVIVTTRRQDEAMTGRDGHMVEVGLFTPEEAVGYVTTHLTARGRADTPEAIAGLVNDLGRLPLALAAVVTFIVNAGLDCDGYRQRFADRSRRLGELTPETDSRPGDYPDPLDAVWELSIDRADQLHPAGVARPVLELASTLDPNGIPVSVLTSPPALAYVAAHRAAGSGVLDRGTEDVLDAVRCLCRLSLAEQASRGSPVRVHNLIQRSVYEALPPERRDLVIHAAADALYAAWPDPEQDLELAQSLRANAEAVMACCQDVLWRDGAHPVLLRAGNSFGAAGMAESAFSYWRRLRDMAAARLGEHHPATETLKLNSLHWAGESGRMTDAVNGYASVVASRRAQLGSDHPDTL